MTRAVDDVVAALAPVDPLDRVLGDGAVRVRVQPLPGRARPMVALYLPASAPSPTVLESADLLSLAAREKLAARVPAPLRPDVAQCLVEAALHLAARATSAGSASDAPLPLVRRAEPWPEPVDVDATLTAVLGHVRRHVVLPPHADVVLTLWIAHTHLLGGVDFTPYLWLNSPVKACGKTTVLELVELLAAAPLRASSATAASLFRAIEAASPTLTLDELDTFLVGPRADDIAGLLNDGWGRNGQVLRCVGDNHDVKAFKVFCPKVLAGIGANLADATRSRCLLIPMQRASSEQLAGIAPLRTDRAQSWAEPLVRQLARIGDDHTAAVRTMVREERVLQPAGIDGRDAQAWEALLAVADLAGGDWPAIARAACVAMVTVRRSSDDADVRVRLLLDIRAHFDASGLPIASSEEIITFLVEDETRGWQEFRQGKAITAHALARILKPFNLKPSLSREGERRGRFWRRSEFEPVWTRYTPSADESVTSVPERDGALSDVEPVTLARSVTDVTLTEGGGEPVDDGYYAALFESEEAA